MTFIESSLILSALCWREHSLSSWERRAAVGLEGGRRWSLWYLKSITIAWIAPPTGQLHSLHYRRIITDRLQITSKQVESVINTFTHPDKTGFVVSRHLPDNIRRLLNVVQHSANHPDSCMALAVDAEKAFDRAFQPFVCKTMDTFGFGSNFISYCTLQSM